MLSKIELVGFSRVSAQQAVIFDIIVIASVELNSLVFSYALLDLNLIIILSDKCYQYIAKSEYIVTRIYAHNMISERFTLGFTRCFYFVFSVHKRARIEHSNFYNYIFSLESIHCERLLLITFTSRKG